MTGNVSNNPLGSGSNYIIVMTVYFGASDIWQLACDIVAAKMWFRYKSSNSWGAWRELATV